MAVYTNDLRLKEIATGDESGTWGTSTNTNLSLIAEAFSFGTEAITTNADTHTTTIADGLTDPGRSIFLKYTGTLDSACTITIAPPEVSKLWFIENATSGSQNIIIKQGSGATVTIANGQTKAIYSDGAGSGGAMVDAFQDLSIPDLFIDDDLTFTSDSAVITFGADGDTTLTHTDGSGLTLNGTNKLMFNDASQFIQGSSATVLSLGATDEIDLTATAIDINGTVDMSSTLAAGAATFSVTDTSDALTVTSTDAGAGVSPIMVLYRNSSSAADSDQLGRIKFRGRNDSPHDVEYAEFLAQILDATDGEEDGRAAINVMTAGTSQSRIDMRATETSINNESIDLDFRVESNNNASMLLVDAGNDAVVVGHTGSIASAGEAHELQVYDTNFSLISATTFRNGSDGAALSLGHSRSGTIGTQTVLQDGDIMGAINFLGSDGTDLANFGASIRALVDGTPGANDMPGSLVFSTTADGSNSPTAALTLDRNQDATFAGQLTIPEKIIHTGDTDTFLQFNAANTFRIVAGDEERFRVATGEVVVNESSQNTDFRVESNNNANMLLVDADSDHINIGTATDHGGVLNVKTSDNGVNLVLACTDTDGSEGPILDLTRDAGNVPSDGDVMGVIRFRNDNADLVMHNYAQIETRAVDVSAGTEDGRIEIATVVAGTEGTSRALFDSGETVFNDNSKDLDFRVESDGDNKAFFVNGGDGVVSFGGMGANTRSPSSVEPKFQANSLTRMDSSISLCCNSNDALASLLMFSKTRSGNLTGHTAAQAGDAVGAITWNAADGTDIDHGIAAIDAVVESGIGTNDTPGAIRFYTNSGTTSASERMRLTGIGNLGLGTDSPISLDGNATPGLTISSNGPFIVLQDANNSDKCNYIANNTGVLQFGHVGDNGSSGKTENLNLGSSEAVFNENHNDIDFRVESDGNSTMLVVDGQNNRVGVGTNTFTAVSSTCNAMHVAGGSSDAVTPVMMISDADGSVEGNSTILECLFSGDNTFSSAMYVKFTDSGGTQGSISGTGDGTVTYNTSSDERLKQSIQDTDSKWDLVKSLQVRDYEWKKSGKQETGFIAQELHDKWAQPVKVGGEDVEVDPWSVDYGKLTPILTKALQEAMEKIEHLESEVAALKGE